MELLVLRPYNLTYQQQHHTTLQHKAKYDFSYALEADVLFSLLIFILKSISIVRSHHLIF